MRGIYIKTVTFLSIILMTSLFITGSLMIHRSHSVKKTSSVKVLAAYKSPEYKPDGCISEEQNNFFIKYTFRCKDNINTINKTETNKAVSLKIDKNELPIAALNTKINPKGNRIDVSSDTSDEIITIKKINKDNNFTYIDSLNNKNIVVLISKLKNPYKYKIVLDPGHGGIDVGANAGKLYEKDLTLKIVKFMPEFLRYNGFNIKFTRETDKAVDYKYEIPKIVNSAGADLFVSIHINSYTDHREHGTGVYYYDSDGTQKSKRIQLASDIAREIPKCDNWNNRGIFSEKYCVLRKSKIPCALVECGFISNPDDRKRLQDDNVLKRLAYNISNGIEKYINNK